MSGNITRFNDGAIIMKEGFLVKRGHVRHNWKTRWFKLSDTSLRYYKSQRDRVPQGRIPLRHAKLSRYLSDQRHDKDREFVMQIETSDGVIYPIQAPSKEELKLWMELIRDVIEHLQFENESPLSPKFIEDIPSSELSTAEVLGAYIDAYGGIKKENRKINGIERSDGFSGIALRVWLEHSMGIVGAEASIAVDRLRALSALKILGRNSESDPFSEEVYYIMTCGEEDFKKTIERGSYKNGLNKSIADEPVLLPSEILNVSDLSLEILPSDLPPGEMVKRGILFKKGHIVPNWKARCFILQRCPATLSYFDPSKKNPKVLNSLCLHGASVFSVEAMTSRETTGMQHPMDHLFCIKLATGVPYKIMASSDSEKKNWMEQIGILCRKAKSNVSVSRDSDNT